MGPRVSPLENEQCRQCSSFADYVKQTKKKQKDEQKDDNNVCVSFAPLIILHRIA